ncbi:MAG: hypothetical protein ACR2L3_00430 [Actinomycetota bacterium]
MRTPQQIRFEAAFHEAAHAAAFYVHGNPVESIHLMTPEQAETRHVGELAGCVIPVQRPIENVCQAQEAIVELLAGEAGVRIAQAMHILSNDEIGGTEVPSADFALEELTAAPNGASPEQGHAYLGWYERADHPDEVESEKLAYAFTRDGLEAQALLGYCRARTTALVGTPRFQNLMLMIGDALLEQSQLSGELTQHLLERADTLFEINSTTDEGGK